jgi:hypothetical protein
MRVLIVDDGEAGGRLAAYLKQAYGAETFLAKSIEDGFKLRRDIEGWISSFTICPSRIPPANNRSIASR